MSKTKAKSRAEIDPRYKWDLADMYDSREAWEEDLAQVTALAEEMAAYEGRLQEGASLLLSALEKKDALEQLFERLFVYAHMKRDENNADEEAIAMVDRASAKGAEIGARLAFFTPELIGLGEETIRRYLEEEAGLGLYRFHLEEILREAAHVLSPKEEALLARLREVTSGIDDIFTMLNNVDMDFGEIENEEGEKVKLTHGNYINFLQSPRRELRRTAYEQMYHAFRALINTIGSTYSASVKLDTVSADIRHYPSARYAACYADNVSEEVYDNLIAVVREHLPLHHRYMALRKRLLGVDELQMHDVYVPLVELPKRTIPYEEAQEMALEALAPLGEQYLADLKAGFAAGWVDVYETPGKTSGAYSFGSYDSKPYVLLNYSDSLQDVFTLVHEMGHSMNSYYTRKTQPFVYGGHSIFTAEVASTVNENLLIKHLLAKETDPDMRRYLLNLHLEEFRTTVFRQTMFAEFEQLTHRQLEEGGSLSPEWLCQQYEKLNRAYFGPALGADELIRYEWARIPHFYNAFYVYKYATGYSAAAAISDLVLKEGPENYLRFLACGENDYPVALLKIAGVDMSRPEPIREAMGVFEGILKELEDLSS